MAEPLGGSYVDEEDCLGFKIWVAELELIVGSSRGRKKADVEHCYHLLQKLVVTLDRTDRAEVREYQRRCEDALIDILLKGAPPPVRRLICEALGKLYARGDQLPLFSRVSSLQLFLGTKEAYGKETSEDVRLGALELTTALYYTQGRSLSIGVQETATLAVKYCGKGSTDRTRRAALRLLSAAIEGVGGGHRGAAAVQQEAVKAVEKLLKEKDLQEPVKLGTADVIRAIAAAGGAQLWSGNLAAYESVRLSCLAGVQDASPAVRAAYASALGELVNAASSNDAKQSVAASGSKAKHHQAQEKALAAVPEQCLAVPFADAVAGGDRAACTALAQAWVWHLTAARLACGADEAPFLEPALRPLEALAAGCMQAGTTLEVGPCSGDGELGAGICGGERPHAQACTLYILRAGVLEQLGEGGQRLLLGKVASLLGAADRNLAVHTPVAVVALELIALLTEALGEVGSEAAPELERAIALKLLGPHAPVRLQAASALAALAGTEPGSAARLLGSALGNLKSAADALVEAAAAGPDKSKPLPGTPRGPGTAKLKSEMNALHGWAVGAAALVAATVRLPLGVPSHYISVAVQLAAALIEAPRTQFAAATCLEREAGYIMLGALCQVAMPQLVATYGDGLLTLWAAAFSKEAAAALDALFTSREYYIEQTIASELWWRIAALQSLAVLVRSQGEAVAGGVLELLRPTLGLLTTHTALKHPALAKGGPGGSLAGASAMMQLRLLQAYSLLPATLVAASADTEALSALCLEAIKAAAASVSLDLLKPALHAVLDPEDASLGPWHGGRDPLEKALLHFCGGVGSPIATAWQMGLRLGTGYAADAPSTGHAVQQGVEYCTTALYPQPLALAPCLLIVQSQVLGVLLRAGPPAAQSGIADALLAIARSVPATRKERDLPKRLTALLSAAIPVVAGLGSGPLAAGLPPFRASMELAEKVRSLAEEVASESAAGGLVLQRAAADLFAACARVGSDAASLQLVKGLCQNAAETASLPQRATLALAAGSAGRAIGGMGLAAALPVAVQTLAALADASDKVIAPWVLQALLSLAHAAGLAFVPHVKQSLAVAQSVLLSEDIYHIPGLLPAVGRFTNAMVAALGPDYVLGSAAYDACRSVVAELRAPDASGVRRPEDALASALESVLYAQMLVLFAPGALPASQHVAVLVSTLPSRQPQLRKAASDTLRHLAERDVHAVLAERIEPALLAALDGETDPATAMQLQATLSTLLEVGAAEEPSRWIALCAEIITAAGPTEVKADVASPAQAGLAGGGSDSDGEDAREEYTSRPTSASTPPPATPQGGRAALQGAAVTPRLRTRIFAARCLLQVPALACAVDPRHADLAAAQTDILGGDWLVLRVQALIDLGFRMASGQLEALRALGVELMYAVLTCLGDAPDPLAEGERLLAQYQAQFVSALRASLATEASPAVQAAGAALAAAFLEKGLAGGDAVVMNRLLGLLCAPLSLWASGGADQAQSAYAEWVAAGARVALLESHAHCSAMVALSFDEATKSIVTQAQGPFLTLLVDCWVGLLHDHAVLATQPREAAASHRMALYGKQGGSRVPALAVVASGIGPHLRRAWPVVLDAASGTMARDRTVAYGPAGKERHAALVDLALAAAHWAANEAEGVVVMRALQRLTAPRFAKEGWVGSSVVAESLGVVARAAGRSAEAAAPSPALLEASAGVLEQLSATAAGVASPETFEGIVSAAEALVAVRQSSVLGLTAALQAMSHQLVAAATEPGNDETYINLLSRCLAASLAVLKSSTSSAEQHTAAAGQVVATARAAAARPSTVHSSGGPLAEDVLSSAAVTAADQALKAAEKASAVQAGANVTCVLALGAVATGGSPDPVLDNGKAMDDEMGDVTAQPESNGTNDHGDDWGNSWEEAALSSYISGGVAAVSPAQAHCLAALAAVVGSPDPGVRQACLESAAAALQRHPPPQWAAQCAAACLPPSLTVLHAALHAPDGGINTEAEVGAAVAALQFGSLCCGLGGDAGAAALSIAVPVLVESAAPRAGTIPALAEAAVKQLAALASGPSASAFRAAVAALPDATKQRLQHALASVATGRAAAAPAPAPGPLRADPSIQLKMFGAPK